MKTHSGEPDSGSCCGLICYVILWSFVFVVAILAVLCFIFFFTPSSSVSVPDPTITIESTTVKAYNITSDNKDSYTINLGIRVHNFLKFHSLDFYGNNTRVGPGCETLIHVEAMVKAEDLAVDVAAAGEGRMNVFLDELLGLWHDDVLGVPGGYFDANCKNVAVDFSVSKERVQKVDCEVSLVQ